jgi:hypothetical protein
VASFDLDTLLRMLATVSGKMIDAFDQGKDGAEFQTALAKTLSCDAPVQADALAMISAGEVTAVTDPNMIANLALFAIHNRNRPGIARPVTMFQLLGLFNKCVLGDPSTDKFYVDPNSIEASIGIATTHVERTVNVWYRYLQYFRWSETAPKYPGIDVPRSLESGSGLAFNDYCRCVVALNEYFDSRSASINGVPALDRHQVTEAGAPLLTWLRKRAMSAEFVDDLLHEDSLKMLRDRGHYEVLSRPICELDGRFYLLNPRALDNTLGLGMFFAALDAGNNARDFFAYTGLWFEPYVGELLQSICKRSNTYYYPEVAYAKKKSIDHFVVESGDLVFFEVRFGKIARPVIEALCVDRLDNALDDILYSKVEQLHHSITDFTNGTLAIPGVARESVERVFPVVVLPHPISRSPEMQARIDARIVHEGWLPMRLNGIEIAPLEIIEAEALEGLEGLDGPISFSDLISRKVRDPRMRFTFFKNFLIDGEKLTLRMSATRQSEVQAFQREIQESTKGWIV